MARIVDASAATALLIESVRTPIVSAAFSRDAELAAPDVFIAETTNAIWNYRRTITLTPEEVADFVERLRQNINIVPCATLVREAYAVSIELNHPAYDSFYLALAKRDGAQILTFDERLKRKVAGTKYASLIFNP